MTNPMQPLDSLSIPPPVTPHDTPSSPAGYDAVTPTGTAPRPAPYDIQAPQQDLTAAVNAAGAVSGAGIVYPQGPRQAMTEQLLNSPQGYGEQDIDAGYSGAMGGDPGWPNNIEPGG